MIKLWNKIKKKIKGFTLVELLAVIVILGIIMLIAIPSVIDVLSSSKQKSFIEYINKVYDITQRKYSELQLTGDEQICTIYRVSTDLGLDETGSFDGYVLIDYNKEENKYYTYITLYNDDYMIVNYLYDGTVETTDLETYDESDSRLDLSYLCAASTCGTCSVSDKTLGGESSSGSGSSSGSSSSVKCSGTDCKVECVGSDCKNVCTGSDCNTSCPASNPDCASSSSSSSSTLTCKGPDCEIECTGSDCKNICKGSDCGTSCTGSTCSKDDENKTCTGSGCDQKCTGSSCEVTCTGKDCKSITCPADNPKCSSGEDKVCSTNGCSQECVGSSCSIVCTGSNCKKIVSSKYKLNLSTNGKGTLSSSSIEIGYNNSAKFSVTPNSGYYLSSISCSDGYTVTSANYGASYTDKQSVIVANSTSSNGECTVNFSVKSYIVNLVSSDKFKFDKDKISVAYNQSGNVGVTSADGYTLKKVDCTNSYNAIVSSSNVSITNNSSTSDSTCSIPSDGTGYDVNKYTVNFTSGSNGKVDKSSTSVEYGGTTTFVATPNSGYYISSVTCTNGYTTNALVGSSATSAQTITVNNNSKPYDSTCTVSYTNSSYNISIAAGSGGSVNKSSLNITYGSSNTFTATPSTGRYISGASCTNGYSISGSIGTGSTGTSTFTVNNNSNASSSTCTVFFGVRSFTVYLNSGGNGSWSSSSRSVSYGGNTSVTITPSSNYKLSSISCTNGYSASYSSGSTSSQTVTIYNNSNATDATCTASFATAYYVGTKTVTSSNGYWTATYTCSGGATGSMTSCSYKDGTVCSGGRGKSATFMCTFSTSGTYHLINGCNAGLDYNSLVYGGGLSSTISCSS